MRIDTALNRCGEFERIVRDALNPYASHSQALERVKRLVFDTPQWKRLPSWAKQRVTTVFSERVACAHHFGAIRWALYENPETKEILHSWDDLTEELKQEFMQNKRTGFHYWVKTGVHF